MAAYCLFDNLEITDPEALADYSTKTLATVEAHGGRYVLAGGAVELKEGNWQPNHPVIIEFPDLDAANAWYDSPEYAPLKHQRKAAGRFNAVFMGSNDR